LAPNPGEDFYDEVHALTGGTDELFGKGTGQASFCNPAYPADSIACFGATSITIPVMPEESVAIGVQEVMLLGGEGATGGLDITLEATEGGNLTADYGTLTLEELADRVTQGDFSALDFQIPGEEVQLWDLEFQEGTLAGTATVLFTYDDSVLGEDFPESNLRIYHFTGGAWTELAGVQDVVRNTITVQTSDFSPFGLGMIPEPSTALLLATGLAGLAAAGRRRRS
jgi:hypothetical protein